MAEHNREVWVYGQSEPVDYDEWVEKAARERRPFRCRLFGHRMRYERSDALIEYLRCARCPAHDSRLLVVPVAAPKEPTRGD